MIATDSGKISSVQKYKKLFNKFIFDKIWNSKNVFMILNPMIINMIELDNIKINFIG